jgi:PAS domain S-box-containing protein
MVTGFSRHELIGTDFSEYFTEPEKAREGYKQVFSERKVIDYPLEIRHPDGHITPVLYNETIYRDSKGNIKGAFAVARDVTERKHSELEREHLVHELESKNTELDRFNYTVSHDLKSPLITIRGFLGYLEKDLQTNDTEHTRADIMRIAEAVGKMERLISTLLELSRSGKSVDTPVIITLAELAHEAAGLLDVSLKARGISLKIDENLPVVSGDRERLLQVMTNLLENAVKFMGDQKVPVVEVGVRTEAAGQVFFVRDNGMGIRKEDQPKIFGLFERLNPDIPGTGIGLATVRRIIEAHGGKIWVESEGPGKGTTFWFTIPRENKKKGAEIGGTDGTR